MNPFFCEIRQLNSSSVLLAGWNSLLGQEVFARTNRGKWRKDRKQWFVRFAARGCGHRTASFHQRLWVRVQHEPCLKTAGSSCCLTCFFCADSPFHAPPRTIREYCDLTNSSFGGMYAFHSPSREETQKLAGLCKDMLRRGGKNGFVHYIRQHAPKKITKEQLEKELRHNLMASLFLGQQSLANGAFWVIVRLAQEPELLKEIRHNRSTLPEVIAEELRIHPPSSPFLMPYLALEDDEYKGLQIGAGDRVVVMPSLFLGCISLHTVGGMSW